MTLQVKVGRCLIQDLLDQRRMTRQQLSDLTGISEQQISDYISGKRPSMSLINARKFAIALNCHMDDLYNWTVRGIRR